MTAPSTEVEFRCGKCYGRVVSIPDPPIEDRCPGGRHVCEDCGQECGIWLDGGTLDLGLIEQASLNPDNSFEIFT